MGQERKRNFFSAQRRDARESSGNVLNVKRNENKFSFSLVQEKIFFSEKGWFHWKKCLCFPKWPHRHSRWQWWCFTRNFEEKFNFQNYSEEGERKRGRESVEIYRRLVTSLVKCWKFVIVQKQVQKVGNNGAQFNPPIFLFLSLSDFVNFWKVSYHSFEV